MPRLWNLLLLGEVCPARLSLPCLRADFPSKRQQPRMRSGRSPAVCGLHSPYGRDHLILPRRWARGLSPPQTTDPQPRAAGDWAAWSVSLQRLACSQPPGCVAFRFCLDLPSVHLHPARVSPPLQGGSLDVKFNSPAALGRRGWGSVPAPASRWRSLPADSRPFVGPWQRDEAIRPPCPAGLPLRVG